MRGDSRRRSQNARQLGTQEPKSLTHRNAALEQEGADLVDDAGALTDQSLPHPVKRLQVKLIGGLRRHKLHRRTLHCLGNGLSVAKIVLLPLGVRPHILRRHQPGVVAKRLKLAAEVMRTDTGLHAQSGTAAH